MKICVTTTIYTHTGGLIRLYIVIWSVLSQFKWLLLFLHHAWRGHGARLSIRTKDPNNHSDTETGTLSSHGPPHRGRGGHVVKNAKLRKNSTFIKIHYYWSTPDAF